MALSRLSSPPLLQDKATQEYLRKLSNCIRELQTQANSTNTQLTSITQGSGGGSLILCDYTSPLTAPAEFITFSSTGQGVRRYNVNGDQDEVYLIVFRFFRTNLGATSVTYSLRPNATTINLTSQRWVVSGSPAAGAAAGGSGGILTTTTGLEELTGEIWFQAKSGVHRTARAAISGTDLTGPALSAIWAQIMWNDVSTAVTSIQLHTNNAVGLGVGSYAKLYKVV